MNPFNPDQLLRRDLREFPPYTASTIALADMERIIKLDTNENPYGPSPKALAALAETRAWNRYLSQDELRPDIAAYVGLASEHIVVGNGADEIIDLIQRNIVGFGDAIVDAPPSFEMYRNIAEFIGARVIEAPRKDDFSLDLDAIERAVVKDGAKVVFIANPSNPDGSAAALSDLERLLALPAFIVFDEAYAEFAGTSLVRRVPSQPNLIVIRTFSKWAGLAGLRIGYAVAPAPVADQMLRTKSPYNVNAAAIGAARASLQDRAYLMANVKKIIAERERLALALARFPFLNPLPSCANFILCRVAGHDPRGLRDALARRGIWIRAYNSARLRDFMRISVGTPEQDDTLLEALRELTSSPERSISQ